MANTVKIPGELESVATGNKVADVANIKDKTKGDKSQFQINAEHEAALSDRYTKEETYNKEEVEQMVTPPSPDYKYYATYAEMIAETSHPAGAIYRVSNYNGTQVDATSYAEYTWNGSEYKLLDVKSQINEVFDITVYNSNTKYADLTAALGVDGANVPEGIQRGGMRVQYVDSSTNNYVQFRCKTQSFSANSEDWYFEGDDTLVENPEYIRAITDSVGHLLGWIRKSDGGIDWAVGVPKPVKVYVDAEIAKILNGSASTDIDGINKIIAFLDDFSTSDTLAELLATKVDKVEGKSLIDAEYANGVHYIENPEFAEVKVDNENRILEAIMKDGTKLLPTGVKVIGTAEYDGATIKTIENPEFAGVWLDGEDKILFGVEQDGNFYFGCGVPRQVKEYIEQKIEELSLDEYESMVAFIGDYLNNTTLEELLSKKVDGEYVENPEFIEAKVDAEDKILEATEKDGTKLFGGDVKVLGSIDINRVTYKVVSNPEWLKVVLDSEDRIICGIKTDGKFVVYVADFLDDIEVIKARLEELDAYSVTESPEFLEVELDAEDKVLSGRKVDGTKFENNNVEFNSNATVGGSLEVDGTVIKNSEDPEGRTEILTDAEGKIISYRDSDGVKHENVGIKTDNATINSAIINHLNLTDSGMTEFQQALKNAGFRPGGGGDWTEKDVIELPEPVHYSLLNLIIDSLPIADTDVSEGYAEYYDCAGNYFKIPCSIEPQGQTSRYFARTGGKGNYTLDLPKDVKFGSWVPQDSFHLKGCAKDVTRGILATSYKLAYKVMQYLNAKPNRVLMDEDAITTTNATGERITDWPTDARCLPDGFPVEVYVNGEYWGLYAWQLKKHRKNYSMDKKDYTSFFLDADSFHVNDQNGGFWKGYIPWTQFEIKNPKDLVCMDGTAYDGDHPKELIDNSSPYYNSTNKKHVGSANTKRIIESFSTKYLEIESLINTGTEESLTEAKSKFEEYFDVSACAFVYIYNCTMNNGDSVDKNTLWGTYSDGKIFPALWDLDGMYGEGWTGIGASGPNANMWEGRYATAVWPMKLFWALYQTDIKATYANLRRDGIISMNTWKNVVFGWVNRIGVEAYERDIKKWNETPSYREDLTNTDYWRKDGPVDANSVGDTPEWQEGTAYNAGEKVVIRLYEVVQQWIKYTSKVDNNSECPVTDFYEGFPRVGGYFNSPKRMYKWMQRQLELCDSVMEYINN